MLLVNLLEFESFNGHILWPFFTFSLQIVSAYILFFCSLFTSMQELMRRTLIVMCELSCRNSFIWILVACVCACLCVHVRVCVCVCEIQIKLFI